MATYLLTYLAENEAARQGALHTMYILKHLLPYAQRVLHVSKYSLNQYVNLLSRYSECRQIRNAFERIYSFTPPKSAVYLKFAGAPLQNT